MARIVESLVVLANIDASKLEHEVIMHSQNGYHLHGAVFAIQLHDNGLPHYHQAMVRFEDDGEKSKPVLSDAEELDLISVMTPQEYQKYKLENHR